MTATKFESPPKVDRTMGMASTELTIDLIVFDMDGVLARLDYGKRLDALANATGKSAELINEAIYDSDFERDAERGYYRTGGEYLAEFNRRIGAKLTRAQWIAARRDATVPIDGTFAVVRRLKGRYPLAALTNNGSLLKQSISTILPAAYELFGDAFHASYEFEARKPEPEVFARLARHCGVECSRTVFVDDNLEYLNGADKAGMHTVHFTTAETLVTQLKQVGIDL